MHEIFYEHGSKTHGYTNNNTQENNKLPVVDMPGPPGENPIYGPLNFHDRQKYYLCLVKKTTLTIIGKK
jgi:hypothetical protein